MSFTIGVCLSSLWPAGKKGTKVTDCCPNSGTVLEMGMETAKAQNTARRHQLSDESGKWEKPDTGRE